MPVCRGQGIGEPLLPAHAVAAVFRLAVNDIARNADAVGVTFHQRRIVAAGPITCSHGRRHIIRAGITRINTVILVNLFPPVNMENAWHTVSTRTPLERRSHRFVIPDASCTRSCSGRKAGNEGLLLHPRTCLQRAGDIMQVSHLVALVGGKSHNPVSAGGHPTVDAES